ncbi:hypothetical protein ARC78_15105 [Stenotrophomonas pictorum JCM 9942]|uniref:Uncharacterized protein n=1 Tax=Stenotrophomonas pictorum JCM 9942 TaxID=1236960 RepID=A0A0R0A8L8_9GAMM|nr:hypothetical protein [Stenotrophomonas pictorum]KRG38866.1 hypothetical protein ARC78_15105 [Stenotrophomonas pictorum JCM 9942]
MSHERDPLELLARMLVGGGYKVPVEGRGTVVPLTGADVAGALAYMDDKLAQRAAKAVAIRADGQELAALALLAFDPVQRALEQSRVTGLDMSSAADRHRLRLIIHAAVVEMVWPERKQATAVLARQVKMRGATYVRIHTVALRALEEALHDGRVEFRKRLFGDLGGG